MAYGLVHFCWSLKNLLVLIYSKLHLTEWYLYLPVCVSDQGVLAGPWPQGLNVSHILLVLNINLLNQCSVFVYLSQLGSSMATAVKLLRRFLF